MSPAIFTSRSETIPEMWLTNRRRMNARTVQAGMTSAGRRIQTISGEKFSGFIRMQMEPIVFRTEICFPKEPLKQDPKFISWATVIPGVLPLIQKPAGYTGEKLAPTRTQIPERRGREWMNLIRPGDPDISDGPILSEKMLPTRCIII